MYDSEAQLELIKSAIQFRDREALCEAINHYQHPFRNKSMSDDVFRLLLNKHTGSLCTFSEEVIKKALNDLKDKWYIYAHFIIEDEYLYQATLSFFGLDNLAK